MMSAGHIILYVAGLAWTAYLIAVGIHAHSNHRINKHRVRNELLLQQDELNKTHRQRMTYLQNVETALERLEQRIKNLEDKFNGRLES